MWPLPPYFKGGDVVIPTLSQAVEVAISTTSLSRGYYKILHNIYYDVAQYTIPCYKVGSGYPHPMVIIHTLSLGTVYGHPHLILGEGCVAIPS